MNVWKYESIFYQRSKTQCFLLRLLFLLEFKNVSFVCVFKYFSFSSFFLTIISRVVRHPDRGWKLSETGEELAGRRHFMGQIRHLRGVRRSTKRLRLSPLSPARLRRHWYTSNCQKSLQMYFCDLLDSENVVLWFIQLSVLFCMCCTSLLGLQPFLRSRTCPALGYA